MDPESGRLYSSIEKALTNGVEKPVEIIGTPEQAQRISEAVQKVYTSEQKDKKRKKKKAARKARRKL